MAVLLVEIGNTALKAAWSEGTTLGKTYRYQGEKRCSYIRSLTEKEKPSVMVIASVSEISPADERKYRQMCSELILLDRPGLPIMEKTGLPSYLPYDRAASIIAARHMFKGKKCTLVDFGTTLTFDFIDEEGKYEGGNVSLGLMTRLKALNRYSKSVPFVPVPDTIKKKGDSMETSVASGVVSGIMFEIQRYMDIYPDNIVIFTGGDANYFAKRLKNSIFVICNLVMMGLALLTDENV